MQHTVVAQQERSSTAERLPAGLVYVEGAVSQGRGLPLVHVHPGNGMVLPERRLGSPADVDDAVASAVAAQRRWWGLDPGDRRDTMFEVARLLRAQPRALAAVVSLEMGMPIRAAVAGVMRAAEWFAYYAGHADKVSGTVPLVSAPGGVLDYAERVPVGVVGAIIPFNGPVMAAALKIAPALAAGNAVVLKPSELAPFSSLALAGLLTRAGVPDGVVNVVAAAADGGARLAGHPEVGVVSFTGGNVSGAAVAGAAAARHARTVLELGGKSASLVFDDVDATRVATLSLALGTVQNSGQGCFLPSRVLVHRSVYDQFTEGLESAAGRVRIGDPFAADTSMGPVVNEAALRRIEGIVDRTRGSDAGRLLVGGSPIPLPDELAEGCYLAPTVFVDVDPRSEVAQEEVFGPVLSVTPFDTEEEAVALANGTRYGLAAYVWTRELGRAHRVARMLDAGTVSVNGMATLHPAAEFGGWKNSGQGLEGGPGGLDAFLRTKNVHVQL